MEQNHHMGWRGSRKNYCWPGIYHITINVFDRKQQPLGHVVGDVSKPDGDPLAPRVSLSEIGMMVEHELLNSIHAHYPMVEVQDYVIMPEHMHFIVAVHRRIISSNGRETHLGQVIAGFKKGCNRRYWDLTGQTAAPTSPTDAGQTAAPTSPTDAGQTAAPTGQGEPAHAGIPDATTSPLSPPAVPPQGLSSVPLSLPAVLPQGLSSVPLSPPAVPPQGHTQPPSQPHTLPSNSSTARPPLFDYGYVDVMPLEEGQLERQRVYIRNNPRYRLMRTTNPKLLHAQRASVATALSLNALRGYLSRECGSSLFDETTWETLRQRLLTDGNTVICDSYGNVQLLSGHLLPVVCHRRDIRLFATQKERCLTAAASGAILVSARIAKGEQDIIDTAIRQGYPVVTIEDNGFPELYHPSEQRTSLCSNNKLLIVTPWHYRYRRAGDSITVAECKTMNCIVQALCRTKDSWWKG